LLFKFLKMKILIRFLPVTILSFVICSGYKSENKKNHRQTGEISVSITLDSINPGNISQKQASTLREVIISSGGSFYHTKSFEFGVIPKEGPSHFIKCIGNKIPQNAIAILRAIKPGDFILVANLILFSNIKYKAVSDPTWTIVADPK